jgi:hypothetical protein
MSYKISTADAVAFQLIEEKTGFGFFCLNEKTLRPLRELFHATGATKTQRLQRFLTTIKIPASKII